MATNKNQNWTLRVVHKSRIVKELDSATIIYLDGEHSTILPKVFRRKKETEDLVFYSLPVDFKINIRHNFYDAEERKYVNVDKLYALDEVDLKVLSTPLTDEIGE